MKMQKLDSKQVPQVIILGVLSVGVIGYAVFNIAFGGPKRTPANNAAEATPAGATSPVAATGSAAGGAAATTAAVAGAEVQVAKGPGAELALPSQFNPDPFKTAVKSKPMPVPASPSVGVTTKSDPPKTNVPRLPETGIGNGVALLPPVKTVAPPPAKPEKPEIHVTGTSVVEGADLNLATIEVGQDHRVVRVGDLVAKGYRVKKIQLEGVIFANKKESFFRPLGVKGDPKKDEDTEGARSES